MKKILCLLLALLLLLPLCACSEEVTTDSALAMNNMTNRGYFFEQNGWVYTVGWQGTEEALAKMKPDGSEVTLLSATALPSYITGDGKNVYAVVNGAVYLYTEADKATPVVSGNVCSLQVLGNQLYYEKENAKGERTLYSSRKDGTGEKKVMDNTAAFFVLENEVYYQPADTLTLNRYNLKSKETETVVNSPVKRFVIENDMLYYISLNKTTDYVGALYRLDMTNNKSNILYGKAHASSLLVKNGNTYCLNANGTLYSISATGTATALTENATCAFLGLGEAKLYYMTVDEDGLVENIHSCNLDGSEKITLS